MVPARWMMVADGQGAARSIHPATHIGAVHLTVRDLERAVEFYQRRLGLVSTGLEGAVARLGAGGPTLLVLSESPAAPHARGTTGLYHFAILVPTRADLASALRRLIDSGTTLQGAADHGVSEALYLSDPEGNGIEIYRDRPRAGWPIRNGQLAMVTDALDLDDLLGEVGGVEEGTAGPTPKLPRATTIGHVHLHVAHLPEAEHFYGTVLGFQLTQRFGQSAAFFAAGDYHHHVATNTWAGVGAPMPPPGAAGLDHFEVRVPTREGFLQIQARLDQANVPVEERGSSRVVSDPSRNGILVIDGSGD